MAAIIAVPVAFLGILAALFRNGVFDRAVNIFTLTTSFRNFRRLHLASSILAVSQHQHQPGTEFWEQVIAQPAGLDPDPGGGRLQHAHDARLDHQPTGQRLYRNGPPKVQARRIIVRHALPNALAPIIIINLAYLIAAWSSSKWLLIPARPAAGGLESRTRLAGGPGASLLFAMTYAVSN